MPQDLLTALIGLSAVGSGMIAGLFFAFSTFIMRALGDLPDLQGAWVMRSINTTILRSAFLPLFFGTTLLGLLLALVAVLRWDAPGSGAMLSGGVTYVLGMFVCTMARNVPLNIALDRVDLNSTDAARVWSHYLDRWTLWNHVRTVASVVACALFVAALLAMKPSP